MKRNPRPRKYASDAERQAAFRARNVMVEFRAENKTADTLNKISDEIDVSRSDLVLSMVKFALTNHDWARFGLTHKTIPLYKGNPMATKKPSPAQLAARQKFADMVRARAAAAKGKKMPRKTAIKKNPLVISATADKSLGYYGSRGYIRKLLEDFAASGRVVSVRQKRGSNAIGVSFSGGREMTLENARKYLENALEQGVFKSSETKPFRMNNPTDFFIEKFHLGGKMYAQIIEKSDHTYDMYIYQMQSTGIKGEGSYEQFFDSKNYKTKSGAMRGLEKWAKQHQYTVTPKLQSNPINKYIVYSELSPQKYKQMLVTENKQRAIQTADINQMENYHSVVEDDIGHLIYDAATRKKYMTNPRKKTVSQKISQLEHEGYPHKQSIAIALSEQRKGKVKRNPSGEIGAYEITRNFKVLGIFKTKADAIKAAQGISDATGKTIAVKPVQVLAGHFDR